MDRRFSSDRSRKRSGLHSTGKPGRGERKKSLPKFWRWSEKITGTVGTQLPERGSYLPDGRKFAGVRGEGTASSACPELPAMRDRSFLSISERRPSDICGSAPRPPARCVCVSATGRCWRNALPNPHGTDSCIECWSRRSCSEKECRSGKAG